MASSELPVDLLEEIFLRLDDAADLARASAACTPFRRVVSDHRFLRRFFVLHRRRRPVLGLLENRVGPRGQGEIGFHPAQSPRRAALAAGAGAEAADFTFSFLPHPTNWWRLRDARDGRVLLSRPSRWLYSHGSYGVQDLVVCDPVHRRHVLIPPIPDDLLDAAATATTEHGDLQLQAMLSEFEPFLAPTTLEDDDDRDGGSGDELSFRVMCNALSGTKVVAFAFSSAGRQWRAVASFRNPIYAWTRLRRLWSRQTVGSCIYWTNSIESFILVLDTHGAMMRFSIVTVTDLPQTWRTKIVVEAGEGRLGVLLVDYIDGKLELYSKAWQGGENNGGVFLLEPAAEWRHDSTIPLPFPGLWILSVAAEGYAVLRGLPLDQADLPEPSEAHYFTLDLKTLLLERLGVLKYDSLPDVLYASFPPPFSPPTI